MGTTRQTDDDSAAFFPPGKSGRWWKKCCVVLTTGALLIAGSILVCFNFVESKGALNYSSDNSSESASDSDERLIESALQSVDDNSIKSALDERLIASLIKGASKSDGNSIGVVKNSSKSALDERLISILIKSALKSKGGAISIDRNSFKGRSKTTGDSINNKQLDSSIESASISKAYSMNDNDKTSIDGTLTNKAHYDDESKTADLNSTLIESVFVNNSYSTLSNNRSNPSVSFIRDSTGKEATRPQDLEEGLIENGIYWGEKIEKLLRTDGTHEPPSHKNWSSYVDAEAVGVKLSKGCGRMQNRLLTFSDGGRACVRYRQNTDQIQGELFSFYLARALGMAPNLAPSAAAVVDPRRPLWRRLGAEMSAARWAPDKPVVLTGYIAELRPAGIPAAFKPVDKHLNKFDAIGRSVDELLELAQWSDLIVFDYLTANLDRVVNNLYNYQWNADIMEAPAHNLARRPAGARLVFLDNESGLLHGYRLLDKYEAYHAALLENLCVFRSGTARRVARLARRRDVGAVLRGMFDDENGVEVKEALPTLPDRSVKILNDRIDRVWRQIVKCQSIYSNG